MISILFSIVYLTDVVQITGHKSEKSLHGTLPSPVGARESSTPDSFLNF